MRTALAALGVLCFMGSCSSGMTSSKGIVCDATMNTVAIVTDKNDTLSFSTMNANKEEVDGLLLNDTLEVFYAGKYTPGMQASKLVQYPQSPKLGGDRDEHGCIGSAGYVWCEVQQDCIRLFEKGIRTEAVDGSTASASLCSAPIPHDWNFSSLMINRMRFWRDVAYLQEAMHGMWKMMIRKMYVS